MRDRPIIYCGLAIFLGLATFPAWRNLSAGANAKGPNPKLPAVERQCVAPVAYMKSSHMKMLFEWRDQVVRQDRHEFLAADGRRFEMSLTSTCLKQCHGEKKEFCDRCHTYAAVSITCWNCHQDGGPLPYGRGLAEVAPCAETSLGAADTSVCATSGSAGGVR